MASVGDTDHLWPLMFGEEAASASQEPSLLLCLNADFRIVWINDKTKCISFLHCQPNSPTNSVPSLLSGVYHPLAKMGEALKGRPIGI